MSITIKQFRDATWVQQFEHDGFKTFTSPTLPGITVNHEPRDTPTGKRVRIWYAVNGHRTESPSDAVRMFNAQETKRIGGSGSATPGSVEQIAQRKGTLYRYGGQRP